MRAELDAVDDRTEQVVLPKSDLRKALNYVRNHWDELTRYLDDADLLQDNNLCEQLMRDVAVGRKNWPHHLSLFDPRFVRGEFILEKCSQRILRCPAGREIPGRAFQ